MRRYLLRESPQKIQRDVGSHQPITSNLDNTSANDKNSKAAYWIQREDDNVDANLSANKVTGPDGRSAVENHVGRAAAYSESKA